MTGSNRRRRIVLVLGTVAVAMVLAYPLILPSPEEGAAPREKAVALLYGLVYLLAVIFVLSAMALVAAREIREVLEQYREDRRGAIRALIQSLARTKRRQSGNGRPLE